MRRIIAQTRKELTQIVRDRLALALALVLPVFLLLLLSTAISLTVTGMPIVSGRTRSVTETMEAGLSPGSNSLITW